MDVDTNMAVHIIGEGAFVFGGGCYSCKMTFKKHF